MIRRLLSTSQSLGYTHSRDIGSVSWAALWLLGLVALIGIPIGVGAGVYLEEYSPPGRLRRIIQTNIANLAGVPSIVYGILGLALFVRRFGIKGLAPGPDATGGSLDPQPVDPADHRDHNPGSPAGRAPVASPGGPGLARPGGSSSATTSFPPRCPAF